jgi:hypothetical protein
MKKLVLQFRRILLWLSFYFPNCGNSCNGWGDWHIAAVTARCAKGLCPICHNRQIWRILLRPGFWSTGISCCEGRDMPTVAPTIVLIVNTCQKFRRQVSKICQIWRPCFNIDGYTTLWAVALKRPIFKQKKGFVNISLGLNFCSIDSSWPRSHDTVPLRKVKVGAQKLYLR